MKVPLPDLAGQLMMLTKQPVPSYRSLWIMFANGSLPADRINGRIFADVQVVAEKLGLVEDIAA